MRIKRLYALYDRVSRIYSEMPFPAVNDNDASRAFLHMCEKKEDIDPTDLSLFFIGEYDCVDGTLVGIEGHKNHFIIAGPPRREVDDRS